MIAFLISSAQMLVVLLAYARSKGGKFLTAQLSLFVSSRVTNIWAEATTYYLRTSQLNYTNSSSIA